MSFTAKLTDLAPYKDAVAGHDGVLSMKEGALLIKPCTKQEIQFYEECAARQSELKTVMPLFYGTLAIASDELKQVMQNTSENSRPEVVVGQIVASPALPTPKGKMLDTGMSIVLENIAHPFEKPNIMDIKLGIRLWADDATPEKRRKLDAVAAETTSGSLGLRIAGMKVYNPHAAGTPEEYKVYDKMYGRQFDERSIRTAFEDFFYERVGGKHGVLMLTQERREVVERLLKDVRRMQRLLEKEETRMYSTSLLLVIEGDPKALKLAKAEQKESPPLLVEDEGAYELIEDDDVDDDEDVDEDDGPDFLTCQASLIDFAHASFTPNKGPDENTLRGITSVRRILQSILRSQ